MKKIALITILDNTNFGTYLQTMALATILKRNQCETTIIHYIRPHMRTNNLLVHIFQTKKNPLSLIKRCIDILYYDRLRKKDIALMHKMFNVTKPLYSSKQIKNENIVADIYMTGSDQVWNSVHNKGIDEVFFLSFAPDNKPKVSYASSIGMENIPKEHQDAFYKALHEFSLLSVREESAAKLLNELGLTKVNISLDPTLLLNADDWKKIFPIQHKHKKEKYILVYSVETKKQDTLIEKIAISIAKKKNLQIYGIYYGGQSNRIKCCDRNFYHSTPDTFISLMLNADFVIVSSFHGTAFSINFNKQFFTISPERFSSRIDNLLAICGLQSRKISNFNDMDDTFIDYSQVNRILEEKRQEALDYIRQIQSL